MTATERITLPPTECAPWCTDGDGHPDDVYLEDQSCWGEAAYVDLSLEEHLRDEYGEHGPRLGVMAYRSPVRTARVYMHLDNIEVPMRGRSEWLDTSVFLTADEALRLAEALRKAAGDVEVTR